MHGRWRSRPGQLGQPAQAVRPNIMQYGACTEFFNVSEVDNGGIQQRSVILFMREVLPLTINDIWQFTQFALFGELTLWGDFPF